MRIGRFLAILILLTSLPLLGKSQKVLLDTTMHGYRLRFTLKADTTEAKHNAEYRRLMERTQLVFKCYDDTLNRDPWEGYQRIDSLEKIWLKGNTKTTRNGKKLMVVSGDSTWTYSNEFEADGVIYNSYIYMGDYGPYSILLNLGYEWGGYVYMSPLNLQAASTFNSGFDFNSHTLVFSDFNYMDMENIVTGYYSEKNSWATWTSPDLFKRLKFLCSDIELLSAGKVLLKGRFLQPVAEVENGFDFDPQHRTILLEYSKSTAK